MTLEGFPGGSVVNSCQCRNLGDVSLISGLGRSPEKEMATHSSIIACKIPRTEEPGGLQSIGSKKVIHNLATEHTALTLEESVSQFSHSVLSDSLRTHGLQHARPAAAAAKSLQSCPTLCDPIDGSPPGSPVPGILQARTLEWVAISFSSA